jgi:hypothetical protein
LNLNDSIIASFKEAVKDRKKKETAGSLIQGGL